MITKEDILEFYKVRCDGDILKDTYDLDNLPDHSLITIDNSNNQIKKVENDTYIFVRKDTVSTVKHDSTYDPRNKLRDRVYKRLDYNTEYADERKELVGKLFEDNKHWLLDLISCPKTLMKDIKNKKDFLSEDQPLDQKIEGLASYILHSKFNNKQDENYFNDLKDALEKVKATANTSENVKDVEFKIKSEMDDLLSHVTTKSSRQRNNFREELTDEVANVECLGEKEDNFSHEKKPKRYGKKLKITPTYWKQMGFADYEFRNNVINSYQQSINSLGKYLGVNLKKEDKEEHQIKLLSTLNPIQYDNGKNIITISSEQRLGKLNKMYSEVVSDLYTAKERLAEIVSFQSPTKPNSTIQFTEDTWYIDNNGKEVEVSKNYVSFAYLGTYSGLIQNYYDLYDKYKDKFNHDMWAILHTFRQVLSYTDLSNEELFVIDGFSNDKTREEIKTEYMQEFNKDISLRTLSNWVNKSIPKKMLNTYLESVDDWLYTYKIKGDFKRCSKCSEIKVVSNDRYFRKDKLGRDGFRSQCRKCESLAK